MAANIGDTGKVGILIIVFILFIAASGAIFYFTGSYVGKNGDNTATITTALKWCLGLGIVLIFLFSIISLAFSDAVLSYRHFIIHLAFLMSFLALSVSLLNVVY
jgi:hypothetical protein